MMNKTMTPDEMVAAMNDVALKVLLEDGHVTHEDASKDGFHPFNELLKVDALQCAEEAVRLSAALDEAVNIAEKYEHNDYDGVTYGLSDEIRALKDGRLNG